MRPMHGPFTRANTSYSPTTDSSHQQSLLQLGRKRSHTQHNSSRIKQRTLHTRSASLHPSQAPRRLSPTQLGTTATDHYSLMDQQLFMLVTQEYNQNAPVIVPRTQQQQIMRLHLPLSDLNLLNYFNKKEESQQIYAAAATYAKRTLSPIDSFTRNFTPPQSQPNGFMQRSQLMRGAR